MKKYIVYASVIIIALGLGIVFGQYLGVKAQTGYHYQWRDGTLTVAELNEKYGTDIIEISNRIFEGYDKNGNPVILPGIDLEFASEPTPQQLQDLDVELSTKGYFRDNGITIYDKITELEQQIDALSVSVGK